MTRTLFVLGGTGFIGSRVVEEAARAELEVKALARSSESVAKLEGAGATPVRGEGENPSAWASDLRGADVLLDLVQPPLPSRLGGGAVRKVVEQRESITAGVLKTLADIPPDERPVLFSISGADDLQPDAQGTISDTSATRNPLAGFARIGVPIRRLVEQSGLDATFVHFGVIVYGPGKGFEEHFVEGLRKRRMRVIGDGSNRLPLVHVDDAARALVHLAGLPREQLAGRTFVAADGADTTLRELIRDTATGMGLKPPGSAPVAVVGLLAGRATVKAMTFDAHADNSALVDTGFEFRYPSHREGVPATLAELGALADPQATG